MTATRLVREDIATDEAVDIGVGDGKLRYWK